MPRGIPKAGFRRRSSGAFNNENIVEVYESDSDIDNRIRERFSVLEDITESTVSGISRALVVSGPPGLGKSYTVEQIVSQLPESDYTIIKGFVRATGLYKALYEFKNAGQVIIFDDSDSIFHDEAALSLLKSACDTTERRVISWRAETNMIAEDGERLPNYFEFNGSIIFITNLDFDRIVDTEAKFHEHISAMISRANYVDLAMKNRRDYFIRIKQVIDSGMLADTIDQSQIAMVVDYIEENIDKLRELSLRMAIKIALTVKSNPNKWRRICNVTCIR